MNQTTLSIPDLCWVSKTFPRFFHILPSDIFPPLSGLNIPGPSSSVPPASVSLMSGSSPAHKMLWDLSWPPPPLSSSAPGPGQPQYHHQVSRHSQGTTLLLRSETSNSEPFTTNTLPSALKLLQNFSWSHRRFSDKPTFFLFLGKPMVSPPGPVCVCGLLVIAYHAPLPSCQHRMIEVVAADQSKPRGNMTRPKL